MSLFLFCFSSLFPITTCNPIMLSRKVTLGKEKHRSKTINNTLNPKWREGMDLNWWNFTNRKGQRLLLATTRYEELDDFIDIALFDHDEVGKDDRMGRVEIDLRELSREVDYCRVLYFRSILYCPVLRSRSPMLCDKRNTVSKVSHNLWRPIKEGEGQLNVIITISGTTKVFKWK